MENRKIFLSGNIFTSTTDCTIDGAIVVENGKILEVTNKENYKKYIESNTEIIDLEEKFIMPGFIDAHMHMHGSSMMHSGRIFISSFLDSEEKIVEEIYQSDYFKNLGAGEWINSVGWYLPLWKNPVLPTKKSLDKYFPNHPVSMHSADGHCLWLNSKALEILEIDKSELERENMQFEVDETGALTGVLHEVAAFKYVGIINDSLDFEETVKIYEEMIEYLLSHGITSISDMSMMPVDSMNNGLRYDIYDKLRADDKLKIRVSMYPELTKSHEAFNRFMKYKSDDQIRVAGAKQFFDGVSGTHTAWQTEDYSSAKFVGDRGSTLIGPEDMEAIISYAHENDIQIRIHTIGDASVHHALNSFEKAKKKFGNKEHLHHSLEHVESILEADIKRFKKLGITISAQPAHALIDPEGIEHDLGKDRAKLMWIFRTYIDEGIHLAFSTDSPVAPLDPFGNIYNAVARKNIQGIPVNGWYPEERIAMHEALRCYTKESAYAISMNDKIGTIENGKYADLIVLSDNPLKISADEFLNVEVEKTYIGGKQFFSK